MRSATRKKPKRPAGADKTAPQRASQRSSGRRNADGELERSAPPMAEIDADALEFIEAIDRFKKQHGRPFPNWSEVLMVLRSLGYRRG